VSHLVLVCFSRWQ